LREEDAERLFSSVNGDILIKVILVVVIIVLCHTDNVVCVVVYEDIVFRIPLIFELLRKSLPQFVNDFVHEMVGVDEVAGVWNLNVEDYQIVSSDAINLNLDWLVCCLDSIMFAVFVLAA
jgi:hypothetical protein